MREISDAAEVAGLCGGDTLIRWAAQGLPAGRGTRAFAAPDGSAVAVAVAVASPTLSGHDRLAVHGEPRTAAPWSVTYCGRWAAATGRSAAGS
ncbi:hypothetical protein IPZ61_10515 [Streptomyces sioyaensis]|uniref:hypothetical protein n=1 Tax=Streptomyces sioyaensis TaxID=67364 RepID=UPI001F4615B1|nr:hypothetical protein [Streptomyces sioyaensis]MCF3173748.1 hypothetical protein [Streptomyces sioyaensis]